MSFRIALGCLIFPVGVLWIGSSCINLRNFFLLKNKPVEGVSERKSYGLVYHFLIQLPRFLTQGDPFLAFVLGVPMRSAGRFGAKSLLEVFGTPLDGRPFPVD